MLSIVESPSRLLLPDNTDIPVRACMWAYNYLLDLVPVVVTGLNCADILRSRYDSRGEVVTKNLFVRLCQGVVSSGG